MGLPRLWQLPLVERRKAEADSVGGGWNGALILRNSRSPGGLVVDCCLRFGNGAHPDLVATRVSIENHRPKYGMTLRVSAASGFTD
jgi:hypothetical protein